MNLTIFIDPRENFSTNIKNIINAVRPTLPVYVSLTLNLRIHMETQGQGSKSITICY